MLIMYCKGLLMQVKKDYLLQLDVRPGDTVYQYTTVWRRLSYIMTTTDSRTDWMDYVGNGIVRPCLWRQCGRL